MNRKGYGFLFRIYLYFQRKRSFAKLLIFRIKRAVPDRSGRIPLSSLRSASRAEYGG